MKPSENFIFDEISLKRVTLVELDDAIKYNSMAIDATNIVVGDPLNWSVLQVDSGKRICNPFDGCPVPFYECMFTRIGLWMPLFEFDVVVLST